MEQSNGYYFLTTTALNIWRENDSREEDKLYKCLLQKKEGFFRGVVYKNGIIHEDVLGAFAETAFSDAYMYCKDKARKGTLVIDSKEYTGFFYIVFKRMYLKFCEKELREGKAGATFINAQPESYSHDDGENKQAMVAKVEGVLDKMGQSCQKLLNWRYKDGLTIDQIAEKTIGEITRENVIRMLSRCKKDLVDKVNKTKNG